MPSSPFPRPRYDGVLDLPPLPEPSGAGPSPALEALTVHPLSRRQLVDLAAQLDVLGYHDEAARVMAMHDSDAAAA